MKRACLMTLAVLSGLAACSAAAASAGFQKVRAHVYYIEYKSAGHNTGIIVTPEGVLLVDPPPEAEITGFLAAMKTVTSRPVRWAVSTDYTQANAAGFNTLVKQGAAIIFGKGLDRLAASVPAADPAQTPAARPNPRILFGRQMQLYPATLEIRILALKGRARTAGDVVVFFPAEKALLIGGFFTPSSFPVIDAAYGEGTAPGWIDALKQVIDFVPLLKSAMPQSKQESTQPAKTSEPDKSPDETVAVITAQGIPTTLQNMKEVLAAAQRLRTQATRAVASGRNRDDFCRTLQPEAFGGFGNLESFAGQLFDDLSKK